MIIQLDATVKQYKPFCSGIRKKIEDGETMPHTNIGDAELTTQHPITMILIKLLCKSYINAQVTKCIHIHGPEQSATEQLAAGYIAGHQSN